MFEEMMKHEKAWEKFCKWIKEKYNLNTYGVPGFYEEVDCDNCGDIAFEYEIDNNFILSIMPFFFDKYGVNISMEYSIPDAGFLTYVFYKEKWYEVDIEQGERMWALKDACIKAFELLNNQLEGER